MWFDLEKKLKEIENKRIIEFFKKDKLSKQEIKMYCLGYADALLYSKNSYKHL